MTRLRVLLRPLPLAALVIAIAVADLFTSALNTSILYLIPLLLATRWPGRRSFWALSLALVGLTFLGYFLGPHRIPSTHFLSFRLVNRILVAIALLATALRVSALMGQPAGPGHSPVLDEPEEGTEIYDLLLSVGLLVFIFVVDLMTPAEYNVPILFAIPLTAMALLGRPRFVWVLLALSLGCTAVGFLYSPPTVPRSMVLSLVQNRAVACLIQLAIAVLGQRRFFCKHVWTIDARRSTTEGQSGKVPWVCSFCGQRILLSSEEFPIRAER